MPNPTDTRPIFHPIIYVRGYAMSKSEQDETTADPFCGFNLGSATYRAVLDKNRQARKFIFESPVIRLMSDFGYRDIYENGYDIMDADWSGTLTTKSIIIYRYYESASNLLGNGKTPTIDAFAQGLKDLILRLREITCANPNNAVTKESFRCYLVAHSMGGLVVRAFLQNPKYCMQGDEDVRRAVDKVFTYATPHNGIELAGINVPKWFAAGDVDNFNQKNMSVYLNLEAIFNKTKRVDWLPEEAFPSERFFCMVGSNRNDYEVAAGLSRMFAGHGSDGLVRIENASVWGTNKAGKLSTPTATAYAYRAHSGYFGIVNSEEAYQNLTRFLFGDLRIDIWLDIDSVKLPADIQDKDVNALYLFELEASPRGKRWLLSRRKSEEDSAACRSHKDLIDTKNKAARSIYLSSVFLANRSKVDIDRNTLAYGVNLTIPTPDYEIKGIFSRNTHYEGVNIFSDSLVVELTEPTIPGDDWTAAFSWQSKKSGATERLNYRKLTSGKQEMKVPLPAADPTSTSPSFAGAVRFVVSAWNI